MSEMIGLSAMAAVPSVIMNVQRGGPSTGIPTKSEQSHLWHSLYGSHSDTPRAVRACTDVEDSFHTTVDGFNIAEEFQLPVIVLSEQSIAQRRETVRRRTSRTRSSSAASPRPRELPPLQRADDGVSPMSIPGQKGGEYQTNGLEHDERGRPSSMYTMHETMNAKRWRKLDAIAKKYGHLYTRFGPERPDLGILCWGSSLGVVREAVDRLTARGMHGEAQLEREQLVRLGDEALHRLGRQRHQDARRERGSCRR